MSTVQQSTKGTKLGSNHLDLIPCPRCKRKLDPLCFYPDRSKTSGRKSHCRSCSKASSQKWKQAHKPHLAQYSRERRAAEREQRQEKRQFSEDSYWLSDDSKAIQELQIIFGPDYADQGIHLLPPRQRTTRIIPANCFREIEEVIPLLADEFRAKFEDDAEIMISALVMHLLCDLFLIN